MFLHIPRVCEHGHICIYGFMGKICPAKKLLRFWNPTCTHKKPNYNRFCVPMHFATDCFTVEKFPPPDPLLHSPIPHGVSFSKAQSLKLKSSFSKAQSLKLKSLLPRFSEQILSSFKLWALKQNSKIHPKWDWLYMYTTTTSRGKRRLW